MKRTVLAAVVAFALVAGLGNAQLAIGSSLPKAELEGFAQTGATSMADLAGRAVLIEFFAYW